MRQKISRPLIAALMASAVMGLSACVLPSYTRQEIKNRFPDDIENLKARTAKIATPIMRDNAQLCPARTRRSGNKVLPFDICATELVVLVDPRRNAFFDMEGSGTLLATSSLVRTISDEELAFVIAHELAHHIAGHSIADTDDEELAEQIEIEADRIALFLMARSGYDLNAARSLLTKIVMSESFEEGGAFHPDVVKRLSSIEQTRAEIDSRINDGRELLP